MLTPLFTAGLCLLLWGWVSRWHWFVPQFYPAFPDWWRSDLAMNLMLGGILLVVSIAAGVGLSALLGSMMAQQRDAKPYKVSTLASLRSADGITGRAVLGTGTINSTEYYFWYEVEGDAVTPRHSCVGVGTYVYEEDRADGIREVYGWHFKSPWHEWFAMPPVGETVHFHIPRGSLRRGFTLQ